MGSMGSMKTTLDIHDDLLARAKRRVLDPSPLRPRYTLPDLRSGDPEAADPLERHTWPELRALIYGDSDIRRSP